MKKLRVGILFGGRSGEHEVSLLSAASILEAINKDKYEVIPIGITKEGRWVTSMHAEKLLHGSTDIKAAGGLRAGDPQATSAAAVLAQGNSILIPPAPSNNDPVPYAQQGGALPGATAAVPDTMQVDVIFPVLHGTFGEDGTIQGLLELADIAYVGAGVLGSAAGMDKDVMKRLFAAARLPIVKHLTILRQAWEDSPGSTRRRIESKLRYPVFVKPANLGSSVGISKAHSTAELTSAMRLAAQYDRKIIVEQAVGGRQGRAREIECSVLGNDQPQASIAGEVVPSKEFYDYAAKYLEAGSQLLIPAKLNRAQMQRVQKLAVAAFQAVDACGLARVDFLMDAKSKKIYVNEINTMPGFTSISMYPKLWAATGMAYPVLIDRLIQLAVERHKDKKRNRYQR